MSTRFIIFILFFVAVCSLTINGFGQQQSPISSQLLFLEAIELQKSNPLAAIKKYESLLSINQQPNIITNPTTDKQIHYNLYALYYNLYLESSHESKITQENNRNKIQPSSTSQIELTRSHYFAKAIWHLESAAKIIENKILPTTILVNLLNDTRVLHDRKTHSNINFLKQQRKLIKSGFFSVLSFYILLLLLLIFIAYKVFFLNHFFSFLTEEKRKKAVTTLKIMMTAIFISYAVSSISFLIESNNTPTITAITAAGITEIKKSNSQSSQSLGKLASGEIVEILKSDGQWFYIHTLVDETTPLLPIYGWVKENHLLIF